MRAHVRMMSAPGSGTPYTQRCMPSSLKTSQLLPGVHRAHTYAQTMYTFRTRACSFSNCAVFHHKTTFPAVLFNSFGNSLKPIKAAPLERGSPRVLRFNSAKRVLEIIEVIFQVPPRGTGTSPLTVIVNPMLPASQEPFMELCQRFLSGVWYLCRRGGGGNETMVCTFCGKKRDIVN